MAHQVVFQNFGEFRGAISQEKVRELIDLFFRWDDTRFVIVGEITSKDSKKPLRGLHGYNPLLKTHTIKLSYKHIRESFLSGAIVGGNIHKAPTLEAAVGMVLTHELQHANQIEFHQRPELAGIEASFYGGRYYRRRPCERDARNFVDENFDVLSDFFGVSSERPSDAPTPQKETRDEISTIASVFEELTEVELPDIVEELRLSKMNNAVNVAKIVSILEGKKIKIVRGDT